MSPRFQFGLEKLLLLTAWVGIACIIGPAIWGWNGPTTEQWMFIGAAAYVIVPRLFFIARAYRRFRDSEP
ncbi:MAG TPA: hypothetical protein VHI52_20730 [Verrucomicrobiae bacterium]|nr:hypothetical protein [Verrucomicrobiae bacterium]